MEVAQSSPTLFDTTDYTVQGILQTGILEWVAFPVSRGSSQPRCPALQADSLPADPQGEPKNTGVGSLSLLQGIFPTQELNRCLLHCRGILYQLSYQGSPLYCEPYDEACDTRQVCPHTVSPDRPSPLPVPPLLCTPPGSARPHSGRVHPPWQLLRDGGPHGLQQLRGHCLPSRSPDLGQGAGANVLLSHPLPNCLASPPPPPPRRLQITGGAEGGK